LERYPKLESVGNFRDIGGYPTRGGSTVQWRLAFRSAALHEISSADVDRVVDLLGIRTVLDLRTTSDFARHPGFGSLVDHPAVTRIHLPVGPADPAKHIRAAFEAGRNPVEVAYETFAREYGNGIAAALAALADSLDAPVVFHCSLGKDRTGVLAAIVLELLGVSEDDIAADYGLSEGHTARALARSRELGHITAENEEMILAMMEVDPIALRSMLAGIRDAHGSVHSYLIKHGLNGAEIERLRTVLAI